MQRLWGGSMSRVSEELLRVLAGVDDGGWGEELREIKPESPPKNFFILISLSLILQEKMRLSN